MVPFVLKRDKRDKFRFAALQSVAGRALVEKQGADPDQLSTFFVITHEGRWLAGGRAALFVAREIGGIWKLFLVFSVLPTSVLDWAYNLVAKNRYRWFGKLDACSTPAPELAHKFLGQYGGLRSVGRHC